MKTFLNIFLILTFNNISFMKQDFAPNGVWIKTSKNILGWNTIIGPDILIITDGHIKTVFLHTDYVFNYYILDSKLVSRPKQENQNLECFLKKNGLVKLVYNHQYNFLYFKMADLSNKITTEKFLKEIMGKWFINKEKSEYFLFEDNEDIESQEKILKYQREDLEKLYKWSVYNFNGCILLELNILEANGRRRLFVIQEINQFKMLGHYIDENGIKREFLLKR